jgi:putative hemolysin
MPIRRVLRSGIDRRLSELERAMVRCTACASASGRSIRVLPDGEFDDAARAGEYRDLCGACGAERRRPVKVYRASDFALI